MCNHVLRFRSTKSLAPERNRRLDCSIGQTSWMCEGIPPEKAAHIQGLIHEVNNETYRWHLLECNRCSESLPH